MNLYEKAECASNAARETNDCAVRAVTIVTGLSYQFVLGAYKYAGRKHRRGVKPWVTEQVLLAFGYILEEVKVTAKTGKTVRTIARHLPRRGTYLVGTKGHVFCYKNGKVHDWSEGRLFRVRTLFKVVKKKCEICGITSTCLRKRRFPPKQFYSLPKHVRKFFTQYGWHSSLSYDMRHLYAEKQFSLQLLCDSCCKERYKALGLTGRG
jgi:hypothetical protein